MIYFIVEKNLENEFYRSNLFHLGNFKSKSAKLHKNLETFKQALHLV